MGIFRNIYKKFNMTKIIAEMKKAGIAEEEMQLYDEIQNDESQIERMSMMAHDRVERSKRTIERLENRLKNERDKHKISSRLKFLTKSGRECMRIKKQLKEYRKIRNYAERDESVLAKQMKDVNKKRKEMDDYLVSVYRSKKDEIKLINYIDLTKKQLEKIIGKESIEALDVTIEQIMKEEELPFGMEAKDILEELKMAVKNGESKELKMVTVAKSQGLTVKEIVNKEETNDSILATAENQENSEYKINIESKDNQNGSILATAENQENSDYKVAMDSNSKNSANKNFRKSVKRDIVFDQTIRRDVIEKLQENLNGQDELKKLSPELFMAYMGCLIEKMNNNQQNYTKNSIIQEIKRNKAQETANVISSNIRYQKAMKYRLRDMIDTMDNIEEDKLAWEEKLVYKMAKRYKEAEDEIEELKEQEAEKDIQAITK